MESTNGSHQGQQHPMMEPAPPVSAGAGADSPAPGDRGDRDGGRKRVSQACVPCARRKTKCDGQLPNCGQCRQRDISDCVYATSKRNKRTRRSSPVSFQPSPGVSPGNAYAPAERPTNGNGTGHGGQEFTFRQDGLHLGSEGFAALQNLSTVASERASSQAQAQLALLRQMQPYPPLNVSVSTSTRLFKIYFSTIHPMWPILYKPMYDLTGYEHLPTTMPLPLLYAVYSIAACVQPQSEHVQEELYETPSPQQSFDAALQALQQSGCLILKPSIETCQTLTILALEQHGIAESSSAALLCSLAASMAIELRLHRAMSSSADPTDVQVRSRLWWNIYVLDKMMACELGRPVILRWEEQDTPEPSSSESDEFQLLSLRLSGQNRISSVKTHTISGFTTTIQLTVIMEKISRDIYSIAGRNAISEGKKSAEDMLARLGGDLKDYLEMLDASPLKLDSDSISVAAPVSITNYVWLWCATILLHRPFVNYHPKQISSSSPDPLRTCFLAATKICSILQGYSDNLPMLSCDLIFPIFTTASTLSYCSQKFGRDDAETRKQIEMCVRWLRTLGKSWKVASTRQELLAQDLKPIRPSNSHTPDPAGRSPLPHSGMQPVPQMLPPNAGLDPSLSPDDWAFLNNFGDPTDEFYTMDANFRFLLQNQLEGPST